MKKYLLIVFCILNLTSCGDPSVEYDPDTGITENVATMFSDATGVTMTNAAAGGTELLNNISRMYVDLSGYSLVRAQFSSSLTSSLVGCRIEYSLDNGTSWSVLVPTFMASTVANSHNTSQWGEIPNNLQAGVLLRAVIVGNGVLDPVIRYVRLGYY